MTNPFDPSLRILEGMDQLLPVLQGIGCRPEDGCGYAKLTCLFEFVLEVFVAGARKLRLPFSKDFQETGLSFRKFAVSGCVLDKESYF
ncbi:hypothetical protein AVEN_50151-1 [Araneus ventricosus]|uniref:Uncharacterized protein n=1 Tax=Araneus ventricosus TaxID=182803 RepID=A0A4Y2DC34_ARAVE|nr:hypothetical protein AVEN_50151-1 [Araneus ventricosus]